MGECHGCYVWHCRHRAGDGVKALARRSHRQRLGYNAIRAGGGIRRSVVYAVLDSAKGASDTCQSSSFMRCALIANEGGCAAV